MATGYEELLQNQQEQLNNFGEQLADLQRRQAGQQMITQNTGFQSQYAGQINDLIGQASQKRTYDSPYAQQIGDLTNSIKNSRFEYTPESDPNFQALRKQYLLEAGRTASDVLGKASAATGGRASTNAISAASQAANYYKAQLNTQQQALFDSAYNRYYQDYQMKLQQLNDLENQDITNYNRWANDYSNLLQQISTLQGQDATDYSRWYQEGAQALQQKNSAYGNMVNAIASTGWTPTDAELSVAGMSRAEADAWKKYYAQQLALGSGSGGSGGGGRGRGYGSGGSGGYGGSGGGDSGDLYSEALVGNTYASGRTDADIVDLAEMFKQTYPMYGYDSPQLREFMYELGLDADEMNALYQDVMIYDGYQNTKALQNPMAFVKTPNSGSVSPATAKKTTSTPSTSKVTNTTNKSTAAKKTTTTTTKNTPVKTTSADKSKSTTSKTTSTTAKKASTTTTKSSSSSSGMKSLLGNALAKATKK